ncbi:MAG: endonuclease III [Balneolaceae bacterium]
MSKKERSGSTGLPKKTKTSRQRAEKILEELYRHYPDPHCELNHRNAFELLIATILSAQTTDVRVNSVTPELFEAYPDAFSMARAEPENLERIIHSTRFYRQKAKSLKATAKLLAEKHQGKVPANMKDLLNLRGVARKTANVVLGNAFGINEGVVVDTHVRRIANRLGLTKEPKNTIKIEEDLMALFPRKEWTNLSHLLIHHGRNACKARFSEPPDHPVCIQFGRACSCNKNRKMNSDES